MAEDFCFADFSRRCADDYLAPSLESGTRLRPLLHDCEVLLDQYHPDRDEHLDCRAGCGSCCIVNVAVLVPEALAVVEFLEAQWADASELEERLDSLWRSIRGVDDEARVCMRQPCAFLDAQGRCSVYPVRPLLCRGVTSTDADSCRESFNAYLFNEKRQVEMNLFQRELYSAAYLGLSEGLERSGLDGRGFELTGLVRYLLHHPQRQEELQAGRRLRWEELA